jgi:hypothetical protein
MDIDEHDFLDRHFCPPLSEEVQLEHIEVVGNQQGIRATATCELGGLLMRARVADYPCGQTRRQNGGPGAGVDPPGDLAMGNVCG